MQGCQSGHVEIEDAFVFVSRKVRDVQALQGTAAELPRKTFSGGAERLLAVSGVLRN